MTLCSACAVHTPLSSTSRRDCVNAPAKQARLRAPQFGLAQQTYLVVRVGIEFALRAERRNRDVRGCARRRHEVLISLMEYRKQGDHHSSITSLRSG